MHNSKSAEKVLHSLAVILDTKESVTLFSTVETECQQKWRKKKKGGKISTTIALSLTVWQFMNEWSCIFPTQKIYGCPISHLTCFLYWCLEQKLKYFHISWRHQGETASKTMSAPLLSGDSCYPAALPPLQRLLHVHPSQVSCCKGLFNIRACVQWPPNTVTANNLWGLQHQCRLVAWVPV